MKRLDGRKRTHVFFDFTGFRAADDNVERMPARKEKSFVLTCANFIRIKNLNKHVLKACAHNF